ncbi:hypothetical protein LOD99_13714 [Oopsacas minuta]|uniref:Uncharacterized protein n=1 Tax=Oopsacas minuta TaxID=111878 RepID=A0AAV7KIM2_9METZ|nr:hypothetical protein LOD99_13714 [Oopsacas minuta]
MNVEKLQLELTSEKDKIFQLESEKTILERTNMEYQASIQLLGQEKQVLQEELELVRERLVQLEGDISALKKSKVEEVEKEEREKISERNDEIALLFKIKLLEEEVFELRKVLPKASERDQLEIELKMMTSEFEKMRDNREDLCKRYSDMKADSLRLEGKVNELDKYRIQLEESKDIVASLKKEISSLKLELHSEISTHTTLSTENQRLELQLDQTGREMEMLRRRVTELDTTVLSIQGTYNELFCLKEKLLVDNDSMDKELVELRANTNLLQEREMRASTELNSVISQRTEEVTRLNSKLASLQEKNCDLQSESKSLELKLSAAVSERISKEETISSLNVTTNKREQELKEALQTITNRNSELQKEIHEIKLEFASAQGQLEISNKRFERKAEELSQECLDYEKRKKDLESRLEQVLMQSKARVVDMQSTITSLRGDAMDLARCNQKLEQEKQKLSSMVKEYEFMQVDNSCRVREELDEKTNTVIILEERLDDIESERNTLHSQVRSLNVQLQFANTQLTESKKSSTEPKRNQHHSNRTNTDIINRPIQQSTSITDIQAPIEPEYYAPTTSQRSKWGKSVDSISSKIPSHSRYHAPMNSASIESQESSSSIQSVGEACESNKDSVNRTQELKCRNAQNLPHLKSSYPIEFQMNSLSERYLQSESPNVEPKYQAPKLSQVPYIISQKNPAKRKALAFEIDLGSSDGASCKNNSKQTFSPSRVLRSNKTKLFHSVSKSQPSISNRKRKT